MSLSRRLRSVRAAGSQTKVKGQIPEAFLNAEYPKPVAHEPGLFFSASPVQRELGGPEQTPNNERLPIFQSREVDLPNDEASVCPPRVKYLSFQLKLFVGRNRGLLHLNSSRADRNKAASADDHPQHRANAD